MAIFTDLPVITSATITDSHVFAVATLNTTDQLTLNELQKSFTGLKARSSALSIVGYTVPSGITVAANGYVGVDNFSPSVCLDIGDQGLTFPEVRLRTRTSARQASYSLYAPDVIWRGVKKSSDTDYYIQASTDGSNYTGVFNIDISGRVGVFDGSTALTDKFYVSGGTVKFENEASGISFDPQNADISSSSSNDPLTFNYNSQNDIILGTNVLYIENGANSYVGINNITPAYALDISGAGLTKRIRSSTSSVSEALANTTTTGYINLNGNNLSFGRINGLSTQNLVYDISAKRLGIGQTSMSATLHVKSTDYTTSIFESDGRTFTEVLSINTYTTGPVGGIFNTYATGSMSYPTKKWSAGYYNSGSFADSYALLYGGGTNNSAVQLAINSDGDVTAKGSYTTNSEYCKGKFIQVYHTRVTGNCIYFNPFEFYSGSCNTNPSGHNDFYSPFSIVPYGGTIEEIQLISSDNQVGNVNRLEIASVLPVYSSAIPDGFVSGFFISPPSNPVTFPTSGIIGYADISSMSKNTVKRITKNLFQGSTAFLSGRLLQYRICETNGGKTSPVDFTVVSKISYTVT